MIFSIISVEIILTKIGNIFKVSNFSKNKFEITVM